MRKLILVVTLVSSLYSLGQIVNIPDPAFKNLLLSTGVVQDANSNNIMLDSNGNGEIEVSEAQLAIQIIFSDNSVTDLTGVRSFTNLISLDVQSTAITSVNLDDMLNLQNYQNNTSFNVSTLSLNNLPNLELLHIGVANLSVINLSQCPKLTNVIIRSNSNLQTIDFSNNPDLRTVDISYNPITSVIFVNNTLLAQVTITNTNISELDLSDTASNTASSNSSLDISNNPNLNYVNIKNGSNTFLSFSSNIGSSLKICVDDIEMQRIINSLNAINVNGFVSNYCSFNPGGNFNEIQGDISIDIDNNSCDPTDPVFSNFNFTATDGTVSGTISSNQLGEYYAPVADGQHTITPNPENPSYWNFSPQNVVVDFPTQNSPFTQDFCVTANGTVEDLEVIVVPLEQARPGFDTDYKVVVKNKGNQTASGSVTLEFEEDFMTLLSTNPTAGNTPSNQLSWSFSNLQPFQMEEYEFTMTMNTPTQATNPLNGGDILTFTGTVTGTGTDAMPADNVMVFDQTVVNSYDPNDKTCLEGETIDPADVGEYVHYMIRFENTGTASAINVVVKDEIDLAQFDLTSLIPLGGSHDYYTRIREGNVVEFIHEDINLDFNDATNDGYVLFKIKTLNTLVAGDTFDNTAEIYFDFNFPIITNTETVTVMSTASIGETTDSSIKLFPNPASSFINLTAANRLESASIMDIKGRMLSQTNFTGNATEQPISLENLSSGIYFLIIKSEVGQKVEKLIME